MYIRDANIVLLVYDIACKESFEHLPDWLNNLANVKLENVIFALVGNKNDLKEQRQVSQEEGEKFAEEHDYLFHEISAKTADGFSDLFYKKIFEQIRIKFRPAGQQPTSEVKEEKFNIEEQEQKKTESKKCNC